MEKWRRRRNVERATCMLLFSALKALSAIETSVGASPGLERLGELSGGRSRRDVLQVRNRRVQRTRLEKVAWCGSQYGRLGWVGWGLLCQGT